MTADKFDVTNITSNIKKLKGNHFSLIVDEKHVNCVIEDGNQHYKTRFALNNELNNAATSSYGV